MAGILSRRWRAGAIAVGVAFVALPLSSAMASTGTPIPTGLQVGPLKVGGGYTLTILGTCNEPNAYPSVTIQKTGRGYTLSHYYFAGRKAGATCTTSHTFGSGTMKLSWGKLTVKLKFSKAGRTRRLTYPGCEGTAGHFRKATGKGTLKMDIHPGTFGKVNLKKVKGEILIYNGFCTGGSGGAELSANFAKGKEYVSAFVNAKGKRVVEVGGPDNISPKIRGSVADSFKGNSRFSFSSNLSSAKVTGYKPFLTGSLKYKAADTCTAGTTNGSLTGKLVLHDPVSGTIRLVGKRAESGTSLFRETGMC